MSLDVDMADTANPSGDRNTPKAPKDKNCPYCGQAFTSSSLGRHLDLYIKEKNPKPPDGIHDVDEIRKIRGGITRRQPRGSLARRETSTPAGTPTATSKKSPISDDADSGNLLSPVAKKESFLSTDGSQPKYPFITGWEATGVINNIPPKNGEANRAADAEGGRGASPDAARRPVPPQRAVSRQALKVQLDVKHKLQDAVDTARAAELALREMLSSLRAAKQHIDMDSMPFDFEPLSLDFPALCLQCLQPPPTLFSSTQHPTPTSWSISSPGKKQCEALHAYFQEEFRKWKITCAAATTAVHEELTYPPSNNTFKNDVREAVRKAERMAESLERQVNEHLQSAYGVWEALPLQRRNELWILELARSVGRRQKELDKLRDSQHALKQENANLRSQIEHLNRLQQPREFKILSPTTIPFERKMLSFIQEEGVVYGRRNVGMNMDDRHSDLGTVVSSAIDRWKSVIVAARSGAGMNAQRPLDQPTSATNPSLTAPASTPAATVATGSAAGSSVSTPAHQVQLQQQVVPTLQNPPQSRHHATANNPSVSNGPMGAVGAPSAPESNISSSAPTPSAAPSIDDNSDLDADAEMEDDDGFAAMNTPVTKPAIHQPAPVASQQQTPQLDVPRTRGGQARFGMNGSNAVGGAGGHGTRSVSHATGRARGGNHMNMGRSVTNVNTMHAQSGGHHGQITHADMSMMQGVSGADPMFMD